MTQWSMDVLYTVYSSSNVLHLIALHCSVLHWLSLYSIGLYCTIFYLTLHCTLQYRTYVHCTLQSNHLSSRLSRHWGRAGFEVRAAHGWEGDVGDQVAETRLLGAWRGELRPHAAHNCRVPQSYYGRPVCLEVPRVKLDFIFRADFYIRSRTCFCARTAQFSTMLLRAPVRNYSKIISS